MVLTLGNGQIWLGAPIIVLQFIFVLFHSVVLQMPFREKHSFSFWHWENDRMLLTLCVFEKIWFSSGNLSSPTWALGSLSLLSIRVDSLVTNVEAPGEATGTIAPIKPAKVTLSTIIFYNPENNIRDTRPFFRPLFCHSSVVKYISSLLQ